MEEFVSCDKNREFENEYLNILKISKGKTKEYGIKYDINERLLKITILDKGLEYIDNNNINGIYDLYFWDEDKGIPSHIFKKKDKGLGMRKVSLAQYKYIQTKINEWLTTDNNLTKKYIDKIAESMNFVNDIFNICNNIYTMPLPRIDTESNEVNWNRFSFQSENCVYNYEIDTGYIDVLPKNDFIKQSEYLLEMLRKYYEANQRGITEKFQKFINIKRDEFYNKKVEKDQFNKIRQEKLKKE